MKYKIYTDGACSGNPGSGGWGAVIFDQEDNQKNISGSEKTLPIIVWNFWQQLWL